MVHCPPSWTKGKGTVLSQGPQARSQAPRDLQGLGQPPPDTLQRKRTSDLLKALPGVCVTPASSVSWPKGLSFRVMPGGGLGGRHLDISCATGRRGKTHKAIVPNLALCPLRAAAPGSPASPTHATDSGRGTGAQKRAPTAQPSSSGRVLEADGDAAA